MKQNQPNKDIFQVNAHVWRKNKDNERPEDEHPCDTYHHEKCFCKGTCSCHWIEYKDVELWSWNEDDEGLHCEDLDEAIEEYLEDVDCLEGMITMFGYRRIDVCGQSPNALDYVLEKLDEEFGSPDSDYSKPTDKMKEAEKQFLKVVEEGYKSWACEDICTVEIDVEKWVKEK